MPCTVWRLSKVGLGNINYILESCTTQTTTLQKKHLISSWRHQSPSSLLFSVGVRRVGQDPSSRTKDSNREKGHHKYTLLKVWGEGYMPEYTIFAKKKREASMKTYRPTYAFKWCPTCELIFFFFFLNSWTGLQNWTCSQNGLNTSDQFSIRVNNLQNQELEFFCTSMALFWCTMLIW